MRQVMGFSCIKRRSQTYTNVKERKGNESYMRFQNQEIYYFNTAAGFETEKFAGRFLGIVTEEMRRQRKAEILFLCIGTDRSTGDSLGPLIGYKLKEKGLKNAGVIGTLDYPVHALNLEKNLAQVRSRFSDALIVAVDASVGDAGHVGYATLGRGALKPGLGVCKELDAVGDVFITGIVGTSAGGDPLMLQSVRLSVVMRMADCISRSILLGMNVMGKHVDNFSGEPALF